MANYITTIQFVLMLFSPASQAGAVAAATLPALAVGADGRMLVKSYDGTPFFWLADTAWDLIELSPAEIEDYLKDRAARGFTVIQGPIIVRKAFDDPDPRPGFAGEAQLLQTPEGLRLNERYLERLDQIVAATRHGLYLAPAVIWGSVLDHVFPADEPDAARAIGHQLGRRYRDQPHLVWIVCGEYHKVAWEAVKKDRTVPLALIRALAEGLESGHGGANLMTLHPDGSNSSSEHFHDAAWLDFNMIQTFAINTTTAHLIQDDWLRRPAKPVVNAEPAYEGRDLDFANDPITPWKVRYEAYHSVFQGAMVHTYGHWDIWQAAPGWRDALDSDGARAMQHLRALMASRPAIGREPAPTMIADSGLVERSVSYIRRLLESSGVTAPESGPTWRWEHIRAYSQMRAPRAIRGPSGQYAFLYIPGSDRSVDIDASVLSGDTINAWWYSPRDGRSYNQQGRPSDQPFIRATRDSLPRAFDPPGHQRETDWVLVLDDAAQNFGPPGAASPAK